MATGTDRVKKTPVSLEPQLCLICQKHNKHEFMTVSSDCLQSVDAIRQLRSKLQNDNFRDTADRLTEIFRADSPQLFKWYKECRPSYMSKYKVEN